MGAWEYFTSQKQWEAYLKDLLKTNEAALVKSIVLIYDRQTDEEKNKGESIEDNYVGFSKVDANDMGAIARKIKAGKALTKGELAKSRNKMQKYWKQLMVISKEQAEANKMKKAAEAYDEQAEAETIDEYELERKQQFQDYCETLRRCSEEGISCDYGICDECPVVTGFQLRLDLGGN